MDNRELHNKIEELSREIRELKSQFAEHRHTGDDYSRNMDGDIELAGTSAIKIGNALDFSSLGAGRPVSINLAGGLLRPSDTPPEDPEEPVLIYTSINLGDDPNIYEASRWAGITIMTFYRDTVNEQNQLSFGIIDGRLTRPGEEAEYGQNTAQLDLGRRANKATASYWGGFEGAYDQGSSSITSGGNTLTDSSRDWPTDIFAPVNMGTFTRRATILVYNPSTEQQQIAVVESHTSDTITIRGTWGFTNDVAYIITWPLILGASFYPWAALRMAPGGEISSTSGGEDGFTLRNPKNHSSTSLSGGERDVEIVLDGVSYYFKVYDTKA